MHQTKVQIRFNDIDIVGHVNNAMHQHYYDLARLSYFNDVFKTRVDWDDESLVLVHISIDYMNPIFMEDEIFVETKIEKIGNKSISMIQQVCKHAGNEKIVASSSSSVLSGFSKKKEISIPIPDLWRKRIYEFENLD